MTKAAKALFLDRDGVIIENKDDYVRSWDEVIFYPDALAGLAQIRESDYIIVLVTNQSAIGRGLISIGEFEEINRKIIQVIEHEGGRIDAVYFCPHAPADDCICRKPKPGQINSAAEELNLDLRQSILIGDAVTDLQAGHAAGIPRLFLVRTGRGREQEKLIPTELSQCEVYDTLEFAIHAILNENLSAGTKESY